jgi:hypothetical protein
VRPRPELVRPFHRPSRASRRATGTVSAAAPCRAWPGFEPRPLPGPMLRAGCDSAQRGVPRTDAKAQLTAHAHPSPFRDTPAPHLGPTVGGAWAAVRQVAFLPKLRRGSIRFLSPGQAVSAWGSGGRAPAQPHPAAPAALTNATTPALIAGGRVAHAAMICDRSASASGCAIDALAGLVGDVPGSSRPASRALPMVGEPDVDEQERAPSAPESAPPFARTLVFPGVCALVRIQPGPLAGL